MLAREILERVREIQIRTGRHVADVLAGEYVSVFKGRGIEFDEVRPYVPGDDVRTIDWNVTARMGEPYVKRYVEERQLNLMLMADVSASQDFGSGARSKLIAFSAIRNDDKVGLTLFHGGIEQYIPPRKGQKHALRVVREVLAHGLDEPGGGSSARPRFNFFRYAWRRPRAAREATSIAGAMEFLSSVARRRTICFVVSDFLDRDFERALRTANRKHDVVAVLVTDPRELELPGIGLVALRDAESGAARAYDTGSEAFRRRVRRDAEQRVRDLERRLRASGIDFIHIDASGSVVDPLVRFFRMREKRGAR
jgi:uncharacterized protein (DUF58 family)